MHEIHVTFAQGGSLTCPAGTRAETLVSHFGVAPETVAAVKVNNEILPLSVPLEVNAQVEPIRLETPEGMMIYRRSLSFLLAMAAQKVFPQWKLVIGHSFGNSYYYTFLAGGAEEKDIKALKGEMQALVQAKLPITVRLMAYTEALRLFEANGQTDTALLLDERSDAKVQINECAGFMDLYIEALVPRTGLLTAFDLIPYHEGFLLRFPGIGEDKNLTAFEDNPLIFSVYKEYHEWSRVMRLHAVGQLNRILRERTIKDYIRMAEAFQAKKLSSIADRIYAKRDAVKMVLIAGPSSSGKTTTAKRLSFELKVMGIEPIAIGLDDYYVNTDKTPRDEKGEPDYECLEALDIPYFNEQVLALFRGEEVSLPVYDFKTGRRREGGRKIRLNPRTVLIVEGIHSLNDALTPQIQGDTQFKLYVSALTQLNLDDHNRVPTSDHRLLRRMVRDNQFRGTSALNTIKMWPSVQRGERRYIVPFQNKADEVFNSSLSYELSVLKFYAEPLLHSVKPHHQEYAESVRLLSFLKNFAPIPPQYVPGQSILREFIGESEFKY
ncbi:MAG: nucleoside kinase [Spirochaetaceae bacterium]|jgi:uridine kinase|nr:nucleoside kinase [Spirochaetaceae bacterium]